MMSVSERLAFEGAIDDCWTWQVAYVQTALLFTTLFNLCRELQSERDALQQRLRDQNRLIAGLMGTPIPDELVDGD